jgi:DNA invertase Pin-like site-specific DNA recombinase
VHHDPKPRRVALYLRVSTDGQTVENQRRELEAVAERHGFTSSMYYRRGHQRFQGSR